MLLGQRAHQVLQVEWGPLVLRVQQECKGREEGVGQLDLWGNVVNLDILGKQDHRVLWESLEL